MEIVRFLSVASIQCYEGVAMSEDEADIMESIKTKGASLNTTVVVVKP